MKIPEAKKLPSGMWHIQLRLDGKSISITAPTKQKAERKAELTKAEYRNGKRIEKAIGITLCKAIDNYIADRQAVLSPSTIRGYRTIQNSYYPSVMDMPIAKVKSWQAVVSEDAKVHAPKTVKNTWRFISSVLRDNDIEPPTVILPQIVSNEHPFLQPSDIGKFIKAVHGEPCELAALLALHSLRRSEIMALTPDSITNTSIIVSGSMVFDEKNDRVIKATNKNVTSARTIPIMIPRIKELAYQLPYTCNPNTLWAQINRVCIKNGLPAVGVHGLRHSFASLAYHLQIPEEETMKLGGWANIDTMRKIYTHLAECDKKAAESKFTTFFANKNANESL